MNVKIHDNNDTRAHAAHRVVQHRARLVHVLHIDIVNNNNNKKNNNNNDNNK